MDSASKRGWTYRYITGAATTKIKVDGAVEANRKDMRGVLHAVSCANISGAAVNFDFHDSRLDAPANVILRIRVPANDTVVAVVNLEFKIGLQLISVATTDTTVLFQ